MPLSGGSGLITATDIMYASAATARAITKTMMNSDCTRIRSPQVVASERTMREDLIERE